MFLCEIAGGMLIGLGLALPLLFEGRVAGVSGYASAVVLSERRERRAARAGWFFVSGLVFGSCMWKTCGGALPVESVPRAPFWLWAVSGLLVGFGSRLGGGCTSGQGVCGLGRLSTRSLASVLIFMGVAMLVNFLERFL